MPAMSTGCGMRSVIGSRGSAAVLAEERQKPQAEHVERGDERGYYSGQPVGPACLVGTPEDGVFAEEACQPWNAGDGQGAGGHRPECPGELGAKTAHLAHVLLAADGVDHRTRGQEEQALEEGVSHQVE